MTCIFLKEYILIHSVSVVKYMQTLAAVRPINPHESMYSVKDHGQALHTIYCFLRFQRLSLGSGVEC